MEVTWVEPKTDWAETDKFNFTDFNRIKNNLTYLRELAITLWEEFDISDMGDDIQEYTAFWDVDIFNLFESNLETINQNIFTQDFGVAQRFFGNGPFIKWDELNRIESAMLQIKKMLDNQSKGRRMFKWNFGFKEVF